MRNKPRDKALLRTRTLGVAPFDAAGAARLEETLAAFAGVRTVRTVPETGRVTISYDLARIGFAELEEALRAAGFPPAGGWWPRLKRSWYGVVEESVRSSGYAGGNCCGVPSDVSKRGGKRK